MIDNPLSDGDIPEGFGGLVRIGSGSGAHVYRAQDDNLNRTVALKLFTHYLADDPAAREAFRAECAATTRLSAHPAVVTVYSAGVTGGGRPWLCMQLAEGGSLAAALRAGPWETAAALELIAAVADALAWAHALDPPLLHCDIKPGNILLTDRSAPLVADFGISAGIVPGRSSVTVDQFTQAYAAPEVLFDGHFSPASEVWSIAATLFEMLTGQPPFEQRPGEGAGAFIRRVGNGLPDDAIGDAIPEPVRELLRQGLAVDRDSRIGTALAFASAVRAAQTALDLPATPTVKVPPPPLPSAATRAGADQAGAADRTDPAGEHTGSRTTAAPDDAARLAGLEWVQPAEPFDRQTQVRPPVGRPGSLAAVGAAGAADGQAADPFARQTRLRPRAGGAPRGRSGVGGALGRGAEGSRGVDGSRGAAPWVLIAASVAVAAVVGTGVFAVMGLLARPGKDQTAQIGSIVARTGPASAGTTALPASGSAASSPGRSDPPAAGSGVSGAGPRFAPGAGAAPGAGTGVAPAAPPATSADGRSGGILSSGDQGAPVTTVTTSTTPAKARPPAPVAPGQPTVSIQSGAGLVTVTFGAPSSGGPVDEYDIALSNGRSTSRTAAGSVSLTVADCAQVTATVTAAGPGGTSPSATSAKALGCVPPGAVRNLSTASGAGTNGAPITIVSWQPPTESGGGQLTYTVVRHYGGESFAAGTTTSTSVSLAQNGGTNRFDYFTVTAANSAGPGPSTST